MQLTSQLSEEAILEELGARLCRKRLDREWSQAELAARSGVSKRTIERIEAGASTQLGNWIRVLCALDLVEALEDLVPPVGPRPMEMLKWKKKERRRASPVREKETDTDGPQQPWTWGDEA